MNRRDLGLGAVFVLTAPALAFAADLPKLDGPRKPALKAPAKFLMVLLHGYGSNGDDLFGLARDFQAFAPTAAVVAPNAPVPMGGGAYSWLPERPGGPLRTSALEGGPTLNAFLDAELAKNRLTPDKLILIGFSQGSVMALNIGLRRTVPPAAIIGYSGARLQTDGLKLGALKPPVLLIQGDQDDRARPADQAPALKQLIDLGVPAKAHMLKGLGHNIDERGIRLAGALLRTVTA